MMNKFSLIIILFLVSVINISAQTTDSIPPSNDSIPSKVSTSYKKGEKYILGGITVTGLQKFTESTVRVYTGLTNGQTIQLPGDKLTSAIKKLYESKQFSDIDVYVSKIDRETVYLRFNVVELPKINEVTITGVRRAKGRELQEESELNKGAMLTDNLIVTSRNYFKNKFTKKGFLKTKVSLNTKKDTTDINSVDVKVHIDRGNRIKVKTISFNGNKALTDGDLRGAMKNTKRKIFGRIWKRSKYIDDDYKQDLERILEKYSEKGYRDARILSDKLTWNDDNTINLEIDVEEGNQYRFAEILFVGNKKYTDEQLNKFLRIDKGDIYNGKVLKERISGDPKNPDSECIQNFYHNTGYVFSQINAVETKVKNDSITVEIRIREDEQARIRRVTISGNEKTNDHIIFRELRVKPGELFSRRKLIRSIRELGQLGFFDANITPDVDTDYQNKTVDINFNLTEKGSSQIELQGGYGGGSFIGTLGLSFNNFSIRNIFNPKEYKPLPMGDGQKLSLRAQASKSYNTYSFSFTEPWLGGKKPQSFSFSVYLSNQYRYDYNTYDIDKNQSLQILGTSIGLNKRLRWPDDYFSLSQSISYQRIKVKNYGYTVGWNELKTNRIGINKGTLNNLAYNIGFSRNSAGPSLIFPTYGSQFNIRAKATIPYSLINNKDYTAPENPTAEEQQDYLADKYKWLEYYKLSAGGKWYTPLAEKLVLMTNFELGYLGAYSDKIGLPPVERYFVGGDGLAQGSLDGREVIRVRGYENNSLSEIDGGAMYNRFEGEIRYSITDKPMASIYTLAFVEAGNSYQNFSSYDPFNLKRSAGVGLRVFMPQFGLLGIDFAHGFDSQNEKMSLQKSGWQTHFYIGQRF